MVNKEPQVPPVFQKQDDNTKGPQQEDYPVRWLRKHYPMSRAMAEIVASEFGWKKAA